MNTLTTAPVAPLLEQLLIASESAWEQDSELSRFWNQLDKTQQQEMMQGKTSYIELYSALRDMPLAVSRETGKLLYMLARSNRAQNVVEFGTSFGVSTIHLAAALRDNGGGRLITTEFEPSKVVKATAHLQQAGLADLVEIRTGDALQSLSHDVPAGIDLLLLDGAKGLYLDILRLLEDKLRPGTIILADDADHSPEYLHYVRNPASGYMTVALAEDIEITLRLG